MGKDAKSASKRLVLATIFIFALSNSILFGQDANKTIYAPPVRDQRVILGDDHKHSWDDMRLLLVTLTEVSDTEIRWKHSTPFETKTGVWHVGKTLCKSDKGIHNERIQAGKEFVAVYCAECQTVIWLYD